ncbi:EmrB/QacA subfamily drug resistance transporter [Actinomycetospora succinea]|uniref:EmrB/QacA subfamily drug resistance transporter n=1 Tax=Actinomycetospora succinea TaxID=663603 RepID=A0A4V6PX26_9PSEU|nr:MFS transporter [Actinomycetospora succinea]TDQ62573.1 EmrB/QacA subfamily drug resistance transporter [Actinomycetospora succinea]
MGTDLADAPAPSRHRRRIALLVIALAQLTIALDATVVNVALPSAQAALGFPDAQRHWVITAYTAVFGGTLLLGGRISDQVGRRRTFVVGLAGFGVASALGALAPDLAWLAVARGLQGAFAALLAPTVLALLSVSFPEPRERGRAFALFGAVAGGGGAVGLVLGGLLAETVGWRGCLFVNVPIVAVTALGARFLPRTAGAGTRRRLDATGAVLITAALVALVAACSGALPTPGAVGLLATGAVLLAAFVRHESRTPSPLLPLPVLADRVLVGACLTVGLTVAGMLGAFLVLTYFLQGVLEFSPLQTGLAFLPLSGALFAAAQVAGRVMARVATPTLVVPGLLVAAAGMALLTLLTPHSTYLTGVLPAELLLGLGIGAVFTPVISLATGRARPAEAGVTAAVVATAQQLGGSIGLAGLNALAAVVGGAAGAGTVAALVAGSTTAAAGAALAMVAAAVVAALLLRSTH